MYLLFYFLKLIFSIFSTILEISVLLCALLCLSSVKLYVYVDTLFAFASNPCFNCMYIFLLNPLNISINHRNILVAKTTHHNNQHDLL